MKLNDLQVKETALDDLDLPIKLKFGYLSSLVLKVGMFWRIGELPVNICCSFVSTRRLDLKD